MFGGWFDLTKTFIVMSMKKSYKLYHDSKQVSCQLFKV